MAEHRPFRLAGCNSTQPLNQAVPASEAWFGVKPEITDELRQVILAIFQ